MMRIADHPILGKQRKREVTITFNGTSYTALEGESIAAALLANNIRTLRYSEIAKSPRALYCGIGHCFECRVTVDGVRSKRACITTVKDGMFISSQGVDSP
ncbi:(2Fe-2S)-binding protein [Oceanobacillus halotolerans]|uniref:(2Fe-2S)-binding protein n=1 Tax=Oceanobacillus halotolerans TaxID=2663380 RepID=UPI0013D9078F|nr:(2Fe-2S)-binding protein [Oceanobacillus halotolerans]